MRHNNHLPAKDRQEYLDKKAFFDRMMTVYGRKPVLEALENTALTIHALHVSRRNKPAPILQQILDLAVQRDIQVREHSPEGLSRISKNAKQDQGVALDIQCPLMAEEAQLSIENMQGKRFIALDNITNPQNLGMIFRSVAASGIGGIIMPKKGCATFSPLVIKASAGAFFHTPIYRVDNLANCLAALQNRGVHCYSLSLDATRPLKEIASCQSPASQSDVFVLGNETEGVSKQVANVCQDKIYIPMHNGVESLNVAVTAALIAFM